MNELVTIVIPCYNASKFIQGAIQAVLAQTYSNWELILVDDHSTDNTVEILDTFRLEYPEKIHVCSNPKKGASSARNFGLSKAKGKFIQFLDADDLILPEKLKTQLFFLEANQLDFVISDYFVTDFETKRNVSHHTFENLNSEPLYCLLRNVIGSGNPIYKIDSVNQIEGYNEQLSSAQDWDFHLRLYFSGAKFAYLPGDYFEVRKVSKSLSSEWLKVYEQACDYLPKLRESIQTDGHFSSACSQYLASIYYLTLIHSKLAEKRSFYRAQMHYWANSNFEFLSSVVKQHLVFITGFRCLEFLERIRVNLRR